MKFLLTSKPFTTDEMIKEAELLVGKDRKDISVSIINEAYSVKEPDHRWVLDPLNRISNIFGGTFSLVNLLALPIEEIENRILETDMLFVHGGNTDYLMHVMNKTGFSKILPNLLEKVVYVGESAGSIIMGNRLNDEQYQKEFGDEDTFGILKYFNFVDIDFKSHLNSSNFPNRTKENFDKVLKNYNGTFIVPDDLSAISIVDGNIKYIGNTFYIKN